MCVREREKERACTCCTCIVLDVFVQHCNSEGMCILMTIYYNIAASGAIDHFTNDATIRALFDVLARVLAQALERPLLWSVASSKRDAS